MKTFYVKRSRDAEIEGPFTIEQVNQMIRQKHLTFDSLVLADTERDLQEILSMPEKQWGKLSDAPGVESVLDKEGNYVLLIYVIIALLVLVPIVALIILAVILNRIH
jgi:hypothetical protein